MIVYEESKAKVICPAGTHNGVCIAVHDLGKQPGFQGEAPKHKLALIFEIDKKIADGPLQGQPYRISRIVGASLHEKSVLSGILRAWFAKDPVERNSGIRQFEENTLVGKPCLLTVAHESKNGETRANITSIAKHYDGAPVLKPSAGSGEVPEWVRKMQAKSIRDPREVRSLADLEPVAEEVGE